MSKDPLLGYDYFFLRVSVSLPLWCKLTDPWRVLLAIGFGYFPRNLRILTFFFLSYWSFFIEMVGFWLSSRSNMPKLIDFVTFIFLSDSGKILFWFRMFLGLAFGLVEGIWSFHDFCHLIVQQNILFLYFCFFYFLHQHCLFVGEGMLVCLLAEGHCAIGSGLYYKRCTLILLSLLRCSYWFFLLILSTMVRLNTGISLSISPSFCKF